MPDNREIEATEAEASAHFRRTLLRVMTVQVVSLALLWWLQQRYSA
jgi:hypothetical protein